MRALSRTGRARRVRTCICLTVALERSAAHLSDNARVFGVRLDADDRSMIEAVLARSRDLITLIGDCGDEYSS
jgi:hypothetical protein